MTFREKQRAQIQQAPEPAWTEFERVHMYMRNDTGGLRRMTDAEMGGIGYRNSRYLVIKREIPAVMGLDIVGEAPNGVETARDVIRWPAMIHLSIRRLDRKPLRDWRDFQRIKNELVGPLNEGVELYPSEQRLVDCANQFHMWVLADPSEAFPFGYTTRRTMNEPGNGAVQRPREPVIFDEPMPADVYAKTETHRHDPKPEVV